MEGLESQHGSDDPLDRPVILFDDVIEKLYLTQLDVCTGVGLNAVDGSRVGVTLVDADLVRHAVQIDGALQETPRRSEISVRPKQKVDRVAGAVDGPVQVLPLAASAGRRRTSARK